MAFGLAAALVGTGCHSELPAEDASSPASGTDGATGSAAQATEEPGGEGESASASGAARYLELRNVSIFKGADKRTHAVAEIFNLGSELVPKPSAVIVLRDSSGKQVGEGQCTPAASFLPGRESIPCQVTFATDVAGARHDSSPRAGERADCGGCFLADVHATNIAFRLADRAGEPHWLTGRFENKSPVEAVDTGAIGALYDGDGRLLAVTYAKVGSGTVASGVVEPFKLVFEHYAGKPKRYVVTPVGYLPGEPSLAKACDGGFWEGCTVVGTMHAGGNGAIKDLGKAAKLYRKACDGGYTHACVRLAKALGKGEGVAKDGSRGLSLFKSACDKEHVAGCWGIGRAHEKGWGTAADPTQALQWYKNSCSLGHTPGCEDAERLSGE